MRKITVYYPVLPVYWFNADLNAVSELWYHDGYIPVAEMEYAEEWSTIVARSNMWDIMQNGVVTPSWVLQPPSDLRSFKFRPLVPPYNTPKGPMGWRSSMIGDLMRTHDGVYTVVDAIGHTTIVLKDCS